jgi:hypothetical protein
MSPEEVRQHADRLAPLQAVFWTPWQALAWAVHRDEDRVIECSWIWLEKGPPCPVEGAELGPFRKIWKDMHTNDAVAEGWAKLWRALESGRVASSGVDAANVRREISSLEWLDLEVTEPCTIEPEGYRPVRADGPQCYPAGTDYSARPRQEPSFVDVRVLVADVLKEFPPEVSDSASGDSEPKVSNPKPVPVSESALTKFLMTLSKPTLKKDMRAAATEYFAPKEFSWRGFEGVYKQLPPEVRLAQGKKRPSHPKQG